MSEIDEVEERNAQMDFGRLGYRIYRGALDEGASPVEAAAIVAAFFRSANRDDPEEAD